MYNVSVVIPCYNAGERFLEYYKKELSKHRDFEFVVVDDRSTDNSFELLKDNVKGENVVILRNEKNCGPGESRNRGIKAATGKYVTFLDADDCFTDDFFDEINGALTLNPDLIFFDHYIVNGENKTASSFFHSKIDAGNIKIEDVLLFSRGCPWGKAYKREILINNDVAFLPQMRNEDMPFTKTAISYCNDFVYINKPLYSYKKSDSSITHRLAVDVQNGFNAFSYIEKKLNPKYGYCLESLFAKELFYGSALTQLRNLKRKEWKNFVSELIKRYPKFYKKKAYKRLSAKYRFTCFLIRKKQYFILKAMSKIVGR